MIPVVREPPPSSPLSPEVAERCGWIAGDAVSRELAIDLADLADRTTAELVRALAAAGEPSAGDGWRIDLERRDRWRDDVAVTITAPRTWYAERVAFGDAGSIASLEREGLELVRAIARGWLRGVTGGRR